MSKEESLDQLDLRQQFQGKEVDRQAYIQALEKFAKPGKSEFKKNVKLSSSKPNPGVDIKIVLYERVTYMFNVTFTLVIKHSNSMR